MNGFLQDQNLEIIYLTRPFGIDRGKIRERKAENLFDYLFAMKVDFETKLQSHNFKTREKK